MAHNIIVKDPIKELAARYKTMIEAGMIPLRIKCPECSKLYTLFIKDFDQGLHCLLGQACPYCKRFLRESDDPEALLVDAQEIREAMKDKKDG